MNKRRIKWEKLENPLLHINDEGEVDNEGRVMIQVSPFGAAGYKFNPNFPNEQAYVGHTNFDISDDILQYIKDIDGVEVVQVISPYRFRVIVGKAFSGRKIRRKITEELCGQDDVLGYDIENDVGIYRETLKLRSQKKPWGIYILPNGKFETVIRDTEDELEKELSKYNYIRENIGGVILSS